jgi:hypothetical protein
MIEPRYCSRCAAPLNPGDAFCAACGAPVATQPQRPNGGYHDPETGTWVRDEAAVAEAKQKLKATIPLTIVALVVIVLVVWSYL